MQVAASLSALSNCVLYSIVILTVWVAHAGLDNAVLNTHNTVTVCNNMTQPECLGVFDIFWDLNLGIIVYVP